LVVLSAFSSACARSLITARIVDSETGESIKEAIVAYSWYREKLIVPGLPTEEVTIEAGEEISGDDGALKIPKYLSLRYNLRMVAYKQGYVCWSNLYIFPTWEKRQDFQLEDGMIIHLERFKENFSKEKHVNFFGGMRTGLTEGSRLSEAFRQERILLQSKQRKTK